jgi:hypothetical protein
MIGRAGATGDRGEVANCIYWFDNLSIRMRRRREYLIRVALPRRQRRVAHRGHWHVAVRAFDTAGTVTANVNAAGIPVVGTVAGE